MQAMHHEVLVRHLSLEVADLELKVEPLEPLEEEEPSVQKIVVVEVEQNVAVELVQKVQLVVLQISEEVLELMVVAQVVVLLLQEED